MAVASDADGLLAVAEENGSVEVFQLAFGQSFELQTFGDAALTTPSDLQIVAGNGTEVYVTQQGNLVPFVFQLDTTGLVVVNPNSSETASSTAGFARLIALEDSTLVLLPLIQSDERVTALANLVSGGDGPLAEAAGAGGGGGMGEEAAPPSVSPWALLRTGTRLAEGVRFLEDAGLGVLRTAGAPLGEVGAPGVGVALSALANLPWQNLIRGVGDFWAVPMAPEGKAAGAGPWFDLKNLGWLGWFVNVGGGSGAPSTTPKEVESRPAGMCAPGFLEISWPSPTIEDGNALGPVIDGAPLPDHTAPTGRRRSAPPRSQQQTPGRVDAFPWLRAVGEPEPESEADAILAAACLAYGVSGLALGDAFLPPTSSKLPLEEAKH